MHDVSADVPALFTHYAIVYSKSNNTEYLFRSCNADIFLCRWRRVIASYMTVVSIYIIYKIVYHALLQVAQRLVN